MTQIGHRHEWPYDRKTNIQTLNRFFFTSDFLLVVSKYLWQIRALSWKTFSLRTQSAKSLINTMFSERETNISHFLLWMSLHGQMCYGEIFYTHLLKCTRHEPIWSRCFWSSVVSFAGKMDLFTISYRFIVIRVFEILPKERNVLTIIFWVSDVSLFD